MKLLQTTVALLFYVTFQLSSQAQYKEPSNAQMAPASESDASPLPFYLALSSGIDNYTGLLGIGCQIPLDNKFSIRGGAGLGAWGGKLSAGVKYENLMKSGWGVGVGYSHCPGFDGVLLTFDDGTTTNKVEMNLLSVGSVNLTVNKNFVFGRGDNLVFYLETGYAIPTGNGEFYEIVNGSTLTTDEELIMRIMRPGGLILSAGLLIGF